MESELLGRAGVLMLVGMLTVFAFLILLVVCIEVTGRIVQAWFPPAAQPVLSGQDRDAEVAVVIAAAEAWRRKQRG